MPGNIAVMEDTRLLHGKATQLQQQLVQDQPADAEVKATTVWVAVLRIGNRIGDDLTREDFLWLKCSRDKTKLSRVKTAFETKHRLTTPCNLVFGAQIVELSKTVGEYGQSNEDLVVFQAVVPVNPNHIAVNRQHLQEINPRALQPHNPPAQKAPDPKPGASSAKLSPRPTVLQSGPEASPRPSQNSSRPNFQPPGVSPLVRQQHSASPMGSNVSQPPGYPHSSVVTSDPPPITDPSWSYPTGFPPVPRDRLPAANAPLATPGWARYYHTFFGDARLALPAAHNYQIMADLWLKWNNELPARRMFFDDQARANTPITRGPTDSAIVAQPQNMGAGPIAPAALPPNDPHQKGKNTLFRAAIESSASADTQKEVQRSREIQALLKDASPDVLERSVEEGTILLDNIKVPLLEKMAGTPDAEQWIQQIDSLKKQAVKTRTVIGIVGNTGAGKSSVINAMLDEEQLLPTNCMRACTAVVTEISYNYEDKPYCAEIEFISSADWNKELGTLFQDLFDGEGRISRDCTNEDTDAGIAYAKIRAVYPKKTREDIAKSSPEAMLRDVDHILGTTRNIKESDSLVFYKKLQSFVDSKEKSTGKKDSEKKPQPREMEFWPLIKVVRLHVKSPALQTGAVIVDLPGVHDANAARAAVAEGYMKQCTGLWIVAPINRAVDDKAAKSLLGESFKRQLKMDGGFSAVTFICSKTDDISIEEAERSLGLADEMRPSWIEMDELVKEQRSAKKQMKELQESKAVYGEVMNDADDQIELWDSLKDDIEEGKTVFPPKSASASKKRKHKIAKRASKKKRRTGDQDSAGDDDFVVSEKSETDSDDEESQESDAEDTQQEAPLTEATVNTKLHDLRSNKREARTQKQELIEKIKVLRETIDEAKRKEDSINDRMNAMCISGRNGYSRGAIQQDFAAGIKELDQELAAEDDEENFNPDEEIRDYDEVARGLPVFCVSSRGYQKLQGRLKKSPAVPGFTALEETEIPQLQAHCEKLTEIGRSANCRSFINKLSQLMNSLILWGSSDGTGANLSQEQRRQEDKYLQKGLRRLETGFEDAVQALCRDLCSEFTENIFDAYETAVPSATDESIKTVTHWGDKVNRDVRELGGYYWSTYKAICRRDGVYSNAQGPHDWNSKLVEPMMKILASGWEKTFIRRLPLVISSFSRGSSSGLKGFHKDIDARARTIGAGIASLSMLERQLEVYEASIKDIAASAQEKITTAQKDINRGFTPVIEKAMADAYYACATESGPGSFARMKSHMNGHVEQARFTMFQQSADQVREKLTLVIKDVEGTLNDKMDEVFMQLRRDYSSVLGGGNVPQDGQMLPRPQRLARKEILRLVEEGERRLKRLAGFEVEDEDEKIQEDSMQLDAKADALEQDETKADLDSEAHVPVKAETFEDGFKTEESHENESDT